MLAATAESIPMMTHETSALFDDIYFADRFPIDDGGRVDRNMDDASTLCEDVWGLCALGDPEAELSASAGKGDVVTARKMHETQGDQIAEDDGVLGGDQPTDDVERQIMIPAALQSPASVDGPQMPWRLTVGRVLAADRRSVFEEKGTYRVRRPGPPPRFRVSTRLYCIPTAQGPPSRP